MLCYEIEQGLFRVQHVTSLVRYDLQCPFLADSLVFLCFRERLENAKLWSSVMACSVFPKPPDVLPGNVTILFTDEVSSFLFLVIL